ncbi:MAG: hypothetical protein LBI69_03960 [Puniceicoccales bacterium]|jgi:multisubunit Na+/H+ antiporter MnhF subunit|nr:hypothetical protein [Puniceicoccales bacterium]
MKYGNLFFLLCAIAIELSPIFLLRLIPSPEKAKILRIFTTLVVSMFLLYFTVTFRLSSSAICNGIFLLSLLTFYGVFPFSRWLGDAIAHLPKKILVVHLLCINATPWLLGESMSFYLSTFPALKIMIFIHLVLYAFQMTKSRNLDIKIPYTIILMNGLLPGLLCTRQIFPFFGAALSEGILLLLLQRKAK